MLRQAVARVRRHAQAIASLATIVAIALVTEAGKRWDA